MLKFIHLAAAAAFSAASLFPTLAQDSSERVLLATFCDAGNIKGKSCARAKGYPNAPNRGCDVTLGDDRTRGRYIASGNPLLIVSYESNCEAHATDNGGSLVFEQADGAYVFRGFQPGMQAGDCATIAKDAQQDMLVCLTGHMGQGIMETGLALMNFEPGTAGRIVQSLEMPLRAEDSTGAFGAITVTCKARPPKYIGLSKLTAGSQPMTVSVDAGWVDAGTIRTACGKGFARPAEAIGDLVPGDAWVPEARIMYGRVVIDLATGKVMAQ